MTFHCAVAGCSNGSYKIKRWEQEFCDIPGCRRYNQICSCDIGFKLLPFPTAKKNKEARAKWKNLINRQTPGRKGKLWSPSKYSRVCSEHFVDGDTTDENPYPTQKLGYDAGRKVDNMKSTSRRRKLNFTRNTRFYSSYCARANFFLLRRNNKSWVNKPHVLFRWCWRSTILADFLNFVI